ncbi:hypothetical protein M1C57_00125 [Rhodococcus pyridinivorans]|uniref:hypothetical protein n=1 Tax=Rhodococcus pyridinivorans TaxID=103816 RepID=UPI00200A13CB|nr:hypothetical protein [Rhodococcus pyridinivorans]UPW04543.1 hypothetical protein M1C57_00125 [Rhodococcus pyridinivorans]
MPVMKRMLVIAALLLIPAALAWGSQALTRPAGSPEIGDASVTVSVVPTTTEPAAPSPGAEAPEIRPEPEQDSASAPSVPGTQTSPPAVVPAPVPDPGWSDVARQPLPTPQVEWDDDWDDDGDDSGDDDWDDDDD